MSLLDCLMPRTVAVPDLRQSRTSPAKRRANQKYYERNRARLRAKALARYWRLKDAS